MYFLLCLREFTTLKLVEEDGCFQASIALILSFGVTTHWSNLKLMHLHYLHLNKNYHLPMFEVQFGKLACKMDRKTIANFLGK